MLDVVLFLSMVLSFATFATMHFVLAFGLAAKKPRWRSLAAMVLPPLAPVWGWQVGRKRSVVIWAAAVGVYALSRLVAWVALGR